MQQPKAFKRITVEFSHEVSGERKPASMDFVQSCNSGIAYQSGVFESHVAEVLKQCGVVKPEITRIDSRLNEPPMFQI